MAEGAQLGVKVGYDRCGANKQGLIAQGDQPEVYEGTSSGRVLPPAPPPVKELAS